MYFMILPYNICMRMHTKLNLKVNDCKVIFNNFSSYLNRIAWLNNETLLQPILKCSVNEIKLFKRTSAQMIKTSLMMPQSTTTPYTIIVEGNIGSGKTTFLNNFINNKNILVLTEPVDAWKNVAGHDLLKLLYSDIKSWAFTFQTYVQLTMMKLHEKKTNKPVKMIERSLYSARNIFVENLHQMNILSPPEVAVLDEWYKWLLQKKEFSVDLIVYLRTDPEVAFQRIKERSRPGEHLITYEYIKKLHECHEDWLCRKSKFVCPAAVLLLDANKNLSDIKEEYKLFQNHVALLRSGNEAV